MQITTAPPLPPASSAAVQPQTLVHALPQVLTQAVAPISQKAITPAAKDEKGQSSHHKGEQDREDPRQHESGQKEEGEHRGDHVNVSV